MRLIDTHSHIHDAEFDGDRDAAVRRALDAGVVRIVALGVDAENSRRAVELAERHPGVVVAAAGVHPHDASDASEADLDALEQLAARECVALVGEIGLDFYRDLSPRDAQLRVLRRQLGTARRVSKPVALHARDALPEVILELERWSASMGGRLPDGRPLGVMHYFAGDAEQARRCIELGFLISVHTSVTHPKAAQLGAVATEIPLEHLVLETDSPYGAPQRYRGKRNEPAYVIEAAARVAALRGIGVEQVAETTTSNALRLLGLGASPAGASLIGATA